MFKLKRKLIISLFIVSFILGFSSTKVFAAKPLDLHIEVEEVIGNVPADPFTASGSAIDYGLVCASGTVQDDYVQINGSLGGSFRTLKVVKHFVCDDGSGFFDIEMQVRLDNSTNETTAHWRIISGTNDYLYLKGTGSLVGIPIVPGTSILDIYDGKVH